MAKKELKKLSVDELRKQAAEMLAIASEKEEEASKEAAARAANLEEAQMRTARVIEDLQWLKLHKRLSPSNEAKFTNAKGVFSPHLSFRKPTD